jgi:hypothetical protein
LNVGGNGRFWATVHRDPDSPGMESHEADPEDLPGLKELWATLCRQRDLVITNRRDLQWVRLDNRDVLKHNLVIDLLERLVRYYRPVVQQIARRSSNPEELTIKIDRGDGRREELYLDKNALISKLANLPASVQGRLGIPELWNGGRGDGVPSTSSGLSESHVLTSDQIMLDDEPSSNKTLDDLVDEIDTVEGVG